MQETAPGTEGDPAGTPRFPFVPLGHCVACVAAAAWIWLTYSYTVDVTPESALSLVMAARWRYVLLHGKVECREDRFMRLVHPAGRDPVPVRVRGPRKGLPPFYVYLTEGAERPETVEASFQGRLCLVDAVTGSSGPIIAVDTARSRVTGASIAGLVVGMMGVSVFAVALRRWLTERRSVRRGPGAA